MSVKPIIFSGPMVCALWDDKKTQHRLAMKLPTKGEYVRADMGGWEATTVGGGGAKFRDGTPAPERVAVWNQTTGTCVVPPYTPGDLLWVRESFTIRNEGSRASPQHEPMFAADFEGFNKPERDWNWTPPTRMPRWESRLTLEVTDVRVQRVQEISEDDVKAEGIYFSEPTADDLEWYREHCAEYGIDPEKDPMEGVWMVPGVRQGWGMNKAERNKDTWAPTATFGFRLLWDSINAKRCFGWEANPWVVALTFTVHCCNVDQMKDRAA